MTDSISDPNEALTIQRKRLLYRSLYRGTQESDLLVGGFARAYLPTMTSEQLDRFEELLDENDVDLVNWVSGRAPVPDDIRTDVFDLLKNFKLK